MKRFALLLIASLTFGCNEEEVVEVLDGPVVPVTIEFRADLVSLDPRLTINGTATVAVPENDDRFTASITIRNDVPGSVRPWHVHFGTCTSRGDIVGTDQSFPRLMTGSGGAAEQSVMIRVNFDTSDNHFVDVHASDADFNTIIACGNLVRI